MFRCGICGTESPTRAAADACVAGHEKGRRILDAIDAEKYRAQQAANANARPKRHPELLAEAARRHAAGEKWDAIGPDYGVSGERLRKLVSSAGLMMRARKK
jgi:hypothetical protein